MLKVNKNKIKNSDAVIIGAKIKELRSLNGLTQEQLSEKLGIDNKRLSRIETGKSMPTLKIAKALEQLFDFSIYELISTTPLNKIQLPNKIYIQSISILNSAKNDNERICYLEALKHTKKCLDTNIS